MTTTTSQLTAPAMVFYETAPTLLMNMINEERLQLGRPKLNVRNPLYLGSRTRNGEITQVFGHVRLDGSPWHTAVPFSYAVKEELIARGDTLTAPKRVTITLWAGRLTRPSF